MLKTAFHWCRPGVESPEYSWLVTGNGLLSSMSSIPEHARQLKQAMNARGLKGFVFSQSQETRTLRLSELRSPKSAFRIIQLGGICA